MRDHEWLLLRRGSSLYGRSSPFFALAKRDDEFLDVFSARTWNEYCDFAPFARRYLREAIGE